MCKTRRRVEYKVTRGVLVSMAHSRLCKHHNIHKIVGKVSNRHGMKLLLLHDSVYRCPISPITSYGCVRLCQVIIVSPTPRLSYHLILPS